MERLTKTSDKGGLAFTFDLDVTCHESENKKIVRLGEHLKEYEDLEDRLTEHFGGDVPLQEIVDALMEYGEVKALGHPTKARLLTNESVTEWEEYKAANEQGRVMQLPILPDNPVWIVDWHVNKYRIVRGEVDGYRWFRSCGFALDVVWDEPIMEHFSYKRKEVPFYDIGSKVFLSREEAEKALAEMEGKNG